MPNKWLLFARGGGKQEMEFSRFDLQVIARDLGVKGFHRMRKAELIEAIERIDPKCLESDQRVEYTQTSSDPRSRQALIISVVSIIIALISAVVSIVDASYTKQRNEMLQRELEMQEHQLSIETTAKWSELKETMLEILTSTPSGVSSLSNLSQADRVEWLRRQESLLKSQIGNPVLIGDELSLGHWRNALASVQTTQQALDFVDSEIAEELVLVSANTVLQDVAFVWTRLVLDSDQISPTGGRPDNTEP